MKSALLWAALLCLPTLAKADEWVKKLDCGDANFVIDGNHSYEHGFRGYQAVIRNKDIINYFSSLTHKALSPNQNGEVIVSIEGTDFNNAQFTGSLAVSKYSGGEGEEAFSLRGQWADNGDYELDVLRGSYGPGWSTPQPSYVGKWILHDCRVL